MRRYLVPVILAILICVAGCSDNGTEVSTGAPVVSTTSPAAGATGVNLNPLISITFSREMNASSLDSIFVSDMTVHHVDYRDTSKTAVVYIDSLLQAETAYQVTVSSDCMDKNGNHLSGDHVFGFTTGVLDCAHLEDQFEPDNDIASATRVEFDTTYTLLSTCGAEERFDFFEFTIDQAAKVKAIANILYQDTTRVNWLWRYLRADGEEYVAAGMNGTGNDPMSWSHPLRPGTYYLQIGRYHDDQYINVYNLTLETLPPCTDDIYEDNDFFDEAVALTEGTYNLIGCQNDKDYFTINADAGQTITVTLTGGPETAGQTRRLYLHHPDETTMVTIQNKVNPAIAIGQATQSGAHYIQTMFWTDDMTYELNIDVTGP